MYFILKMVVLLSSETSASSYQSTQRNNQEDVKRASLKSRTKALSLIRLRWLKNTINNKACRQFSLPASEFENSRFILRSSLFLLLTFHCSGIRFRSCILYKYFRHSANAHQSLPRLGFHGRSYEDRKKYSQGFLSRTLRNAYLEYLSF